MTKTPTSACFGLLRAASFLIVMATLVGCFGGWQMPLDGQGGGTASAGMPDPNDSPMPTASASPAPASPDANTLTGNGNTTMDANALNGNTMDANTMNGNTCQPIAAFFDAQMWTPIMSTTCVGCHQDASNPFHLTAGDPNASLMATETEAQKTGANNTSLLLLKPSGQTQHGGGTVFSNTSTTYKAFQAFVTAVQTNAQCVTPP